MSSKWRLKERAMGRERDREGDKGTKSEVGEK